MTLQAVVASGDRIGTLHSGYECGHCHEPLGVLWVHTAAGMVPQACDLAANPLSNCPRCHHQVDALTLFGPAQAYPQ